MSFFVNPKLVIFQARAFNPEVLSPGRWTIFTPQKRKSVVAIGKDEFPKILSILLNFNEGDLSDDTLNELKLNDLLIDHVDVDSDNDLSSVYLDAVYDYPFRDYTDPNWYRDDRITMKEYASFGKVPKDKGNSSYNEGLIYENTADAFKFDFSDSLGDLSNIFNIIFDIAHPTHKILNHPDNPGEKKIVPSGGGKHPIEYQLTLYEKVGDLNPGIYTYVAKDNSFVLVRSFNEDGHGAKLSLRLNPDPAMWRYRDIRSFRAVFVDIGHALEMIVELSSSAKINYVIETNSLKNNSDIYSIDKPEIVQVYYNIGEPKSEQPVAVSEENIDFDTIYLRTNPFLYFTIQESSLIAHLLFPKKESNKISINQFQIMNYCLPSRRRDRPASFKDLVSKFESEDEIKGLIKKGFLIPQKDSDQYYQHISKWVNRNWYFNLLVLLDQLTMDSEREKLEIVPPEKIINKHLNLLDRHTTRKFLKAPIAEEKLRNVFSYNFVKDLLTDKELSIVINVQEKTGSLYGLYRLNESGFMMINAKPISRERVRTIVTNQPYAALGAVDVFICHSVNSDTIIKTMIKLGVVCQRFITRSTNFGIQVFETPAIADAIADNTLNMSGTAYYYLEMGYEFKKDN